MVIWNPTAKFNCRQYFWLYGIFNSGSGHSVHCTRIDRVTDGTHEHYLAEKGPTYQIIPHG